MSRFALSTLVALAFFYTTVLAQPDPADPTPLTAKQYPYTAIALDPVTSAIRGPQYGYNQCNSTTQNQNSLCQTAIFNNISDFCLWAPPKPNSTIGDTEAYEVAWCTKPHGARLIPAGAIMGLQWLITAEYQQIVGFIDQTLVDMAASDYGGELDPHGADLRGNPLGGLMYSDAFGEQGGTFIQVNDWNAFIGGGSFCTTICNPGSSSANQSAFCENRYDEVGCVYNMPNNAKNGTFEVCDADLKTPVGLYTSGGATLTYTQPYTGTISVPYTPNVPASSNCQTYQSTDLFPGLPSPTGASAGASATGSSASKASSSSSAGAPASTSNDASALGISSVAGMLGTLFAIAFLS